MKKLGLLEIPMETWHKMTFEQTVASLQHSCVEIQDSKLPLLDSLAVTKSECIAIAQVLISGNAKTFAATHFGKPNEWRQLKAPGAPAEYFANLALIASKRLWAKYTGIDKPDSALISRWSHSFRAIVAAFTPDFARFGILMSPALTAPSYKQMLSGLKDAHVIWFGGFSPISIAGIWAIRQHFLEAGTDLVLDLDEGLAAHAAQSYRIAYRRENALHSRLASECADVVCTNFLVDHLTVPHDSEVEQERYQMLSEAYRLLKPGGRIAMVELPVKGDTKVSLTSVLSELGFSSISVEHAKRLENHHYVWRFIKSGSMLRVKQMDGTRKNEYETWMISAVKA